MDNNEIIEAIRQCWEENGEKTFPIMTSTEISECQDFIERVEDDVFHAGYTPGFAADDDSKFKVECDLVSIDFEECWVQFQVPEKILGKGFHVGTAVIDFTGCQA